MVSYTDDEYGDELEEDQEQIVINNRINENDRKIAKILRVIVRKPKQNLTLYDKQFLKSRASYLTDADRRNYKEIIEADWSGQKAPEDQEIKVALTLEDMTRNELNQKARDLRIPEPQVYPDKKSLIEVIRTAQSEAE